MANSHDSVNYRIRPAKSIERKMLSEAFRKLSVFGSVESYRYIGFGSIYFVDFVLLHKDLNIKNMISIECDIKKIARFHFNKPYEKIVLKEGFSYDILPTLPWDLRAIIWLDYFYCHGFCNTLIFKQVMLSGQEHHWALSQSVPKRGWPG